MKEKSIIISKAKTENNILFLTISQGAENKNYQFSWPDFNNRSFEILFLKFFGQEYVIIYFRNEKIISLYFKREDEENYSPIDERKVN